MKSLWILLVIGLAGWQAANAGHAPTVLKVSTYNNAPVRVLVDGIAQGPYASYSQIEGLAPGVHRIKVIAMVQRSYGWHPVQRTIFYGPVELYAGFEVHALINKWNQPEIFTSALYAPPVPQYHGYGEHHFYPEPSPRPMAQKDFQLLLRTIDSKAFESTKLDIAMQAMKDSYFTSNQVLSLMKLFSFDSSRLTLAKAAYDSTVDQERYFIVNDAFAFESSIQQLNDHLYR